MPALSSGVNPLAQIDIDRLMIGLKAVRLETLDEAGRKIGRGSGFLLKENDGLFLYTCWHVVTGVDFLNPTPNDPPAKRATIKMYCQDVQVRQPGIQSIGGNFTLECSLYDQSGNPIWRQDPNSREQPDLLALNIHVPKFVDVVRIPIQPLSNEITEIVAFETPDILSEFLLPGSDVLVVGYPYGYSSMGTASPSPVFIKRSIASTMTENAGVTLLDGGAGKGMSGAPVIFTKADKCWLLGMYTGIIFPDYRSEPQITENDRHAALGMMTHLWVARGFMQVPSAGRNT